MNHLDKYTINVSDLPVGVHTFDFEIGDDFFTEFGAEQDNPDIVGGHVWVTIEFRKSNNLMELDFDMEGEATVACDRCLDDLTLPVDWLSTLVVYPGDDPGLDEDDMEREEDIIYLPEGASTINIAQYIYESVWLSLPMQRIHPDDEQGHSTCNKEMLAKLQELQDSAAKNKEEGSPWNKLKDLNSDN